jgi:predicted nucleotidyltransferase
MGIYSENTLSNYCSVISDTEQKRIENAKSMIKSAINNSAEFNGFDYEIFEQGSYANNTNIKIDSDIDICVMLKSSFYSEYPSGLTSRNYGFRTGTMTYDKYKRRIFRTLDKKFGDDIKIGNKSIKIKSNSYRVNADIIVAFQYRNYKLLNSKNPNHFIEGIKLFSGKDEEVINYLKRHIENVKNKNKETSGMYKKLIKIFKNIKNDMVDKQVLNADIVSSFFIEALIYNLPNDKIVAYSDWNNTIRNAIYYLWNEFNQKKCDNWTEPSKCIYLFHSNRKWTQQDAQDFLLKIWQYMEYK